MATTKGDSHPVKPQFAARKGPRQARSRVTVDSIMQASVDLAEKHGFHSLTTTRIAERAGISVGSLYEYFPNKEAVLLALYESTCTRAANRARELIGEILDLPVEKAIPKSIEKLLEVHRANKLILLDLVSEMPELKLANHPISYDSLMRSSIAAYLQYLNIRVSQQELQRRQFFIRQTMMGCIRQYLQHPPENMSRKEFIDELSKLLVPYVKDVSPLPKRRAGSNGARRK